MILTKQQIEAGIIVEGDGHILTLKSGNKVVARFGIHASVEAIREAADNYLEGGSHEQKAQC